MRTLSDIVTSALSSASSTMKLASARDAQPDVADDLAFLDADLIALTKTSSDAPPGEEEDADSKRKAAAKTASAQEVLSDAEYAMKLAESLDIASAIVATKLAESDVVHGNTGSPQAAPGPTIMESGMISASTTVPKATANVSDRITGAPPAGTAGGLPTTRDDFTHRGDHSGAPRNHPGKTAGLLPEDWTTNKTAALRLLRAKQAEAEVLLNAGQIKQATALLEEIKAGTAKLAQDPSSPQPVMPGHSENFRLDTEPGDSSHIGDNASLIGITKAQAKDGTVRETTQHFSEQPKKDPAVAAHMLRTDGQKISSDPVILRELLARSIKTAQDPTATAEQRTKAAALLQTVKDRIGAKAAVDLLS